MFGYISKREADKLREKIAELQRILSDEERVARDVKIGLEFKAQWDPDSVKNLKNRLRFFEEARREQRDSLARALVLQGCDANGAVTKAQIVYPEPPNV